MHFRYLDKLAFCHGWMLARPGDVGRFVYIVFPFKAWAIPFYVSGFLCYGRGILGQASKRLERLFVLRKGCPLLRKEFLLLQVSLIM